MSVLSALFTALLPNRAWNRRVKNLHDPHARLVYIALRIGLAILAVLLIWFFGIQQHGWLR